MAGMSWLAVPLGVFGCLMVTFSAYGAGGAGANALGFFLLLVGAVIFLRGNRLKSQKREERRHQEMIAAIAARDKAKLD
jgi:hypothetical protein